MNKNKPKLVSVADRNGDTLYSADWHREARRSILLHQLRAERAARDAVCFNGESKSGPRTGTHPMATRIPEETTVPVVVAVFIAVNMLLLGIAIGTIL